MNCDSNKKILEINSRLKIKERYDYIIIPNIFSLINYRFINIYLFYLKRKLYKNGHILIYLNYKDLKNIKFKNAFIYYLEKSYDAIEEVKNISYFKNKREENLLLIDIPKKYKNEEELIYKKFSLKRGDNYKITTKIFKKDGDIKVIKEPANTKSINHIINIKKYEQILNDQYKNTVLELNKCEIKNNSIEFEYIDGKNLEEILDEYYKENNIFKIKKIAEYYIDILKNNISKNNKFYYTEEFKEIFGDIKLNKDYYAAEINNIDLIFSNIIIKNNKWNIIDYEWVFEFPIPIDFIIYRNFFLYAYNKNDDNLHEILLHEILGISEEEEMVFTEMEHNLQLYILGVLTTNNFN